MTIQPDDPRHGTRVGYQYHLCRCDDCRKAYSAYAAKLRAKNGLAPSHVIYQKATRRAASWVKEVHPEVWDRIVGQLYAEAER